MTPPYRTLFLCEHNSARSIIGECLLRRKSAGRFLSFSAGAKAQKDIHPIARWVLKDRYDIDAKDVRSKCWDELPGARFDIVITLCDKVRESCPVWPGHPIVVHWGSPDPVGFPGTEKEVRWRFIQVASQISRRLDLLCSLPDNQLQQLALDHIARATPLSAEAELASA